MSACKHLRCITHTRLAQSCSTLHAFNDSVRLTGDDMLANAGLSCCFWQFCKAPQYDKTHLAPGCVIVTPPLPFHSDQQDFDICLSVIVRVHNTQLPSRLGPRLSSTVGPMRVPNSGQLYRKVSLLCPPTSSSLCNTRSLWASIVRQATNRCYYSCNP